MSRHVLAALSILTPLLACSGGTTGGLGDGGPSTSSGGDLPEPGASSSSSSSSSGAAETCTPRAAPESATPAGAFELDFADFTAGDEGDGWRVLGHDRDEQCSTATSPPVCHRPAGTTSASQIDGTDGIDNAFGRAVIPLLARYSGTLHYKGKISGSATGAGQISFALAGGRTLDVPLAFLRLERNGTSAILSAVVRTDVFVSNVTKVSGALSKSLCARDALDALTQSIAQASDIGDGGAPDPSRPCDHISLGAMLTGLSASKVLPPAPVDPDPCTTR